MGRAWGGVSADSSLGGFYVRWFKQCGEQWRGKVMRLRAYLYSIWSYQALRRRHAQARMGTIRKVRQLTSIIHLSARMATNSAQPLGENSPTGWLNATAQHAEGRQSVHIVHLLRGTIASTCFEICMNGIDGGSLTCKAVTAA